MEFCLEIAEHFTKDHAFQINSLFHKLYFTTPIKYEEKIIVFLEKKIAEGYEFIAAFNVLFAIGTQKSIDFLKKHLDDENDILRNKVSSCIQHIYERMNVLWYNEEEIIN